MPGPAYPVVSNGQPAGVPLKAPEQIPSPSNPKMSVFEVRVTFGIATPDWLSTPTSVSSAPSYGLPLFGSPSTETVPSDWNTSSTAQPCACPIAGHSVNGGEGLVAADAGPAAVARHAAAIAASATAAAVRRGGRRRGLVRRSRGWRNRSFDTVGPPEF